MIKKDAEKLLILVNNYDAMGALEYYVNLRIERLSKDFLTAQTIEEVRGLQKTIEELKRFKSLRDEVNNPIEV